VKTVLDLRDEPDQIQSEKRAVESAGMRFVSIPMHGLSSPTEEQIGRALALLSDSSYAPVFVHCRRGADRTGTVIACYRISMEHWQNDKALAEAQSCGMSWMERAMRRYVLAFHPGAAAPVIAAQ
jgi:protein tyrosine/serine phosphatase